MNHPDTASFMAAQIAIANWYLDRALRASGDASSRYLHYARQAYDIVVQLNETSQRVNQELSVLRQRLQGAQRGRGDLNGVAMPSSAPLLDSSTS